MRPVPSQVISRKALPLWKIRASIEALFVAVLPVGYYFLTRYLPLPNWGLWAIILFYITFFIFYVFVLPHIRWKRWRYEVLDEEVDIQYGVLIVRRTLIPMNRVQHVDTEHGPLMRKYKLAAVTISTAATVHQIPALTVEVAENLRDQISKLATEADTDD
ncbi:PH domain-containing protein [Bacillus sp. FJAT-45350]|uniref:PH domain-containing protein n=1 Tax=Bacillus sp. FJAT-45350 TaxID=2011014 RepID=UPI000BB6B4D6|nr:PH domain-containing protein [Bacillus sp. FJAT-45350]